MKQTKYAPKKGPSQTAVQEVKEIEDSQMAKQVLENFHAYCEYLQEGTEEEPKKNIPNDHFSFYQELKTVYQKKEDQIFYQFLNKVYDSSEKQIMELLPIYLEDLVKTKIINSVEMTKGVSKFFKAVPDLTNDYPKITIYLSQTLFTLIELDAIKVSDLVWVEPPQKDNEDDMVFVEQYYHLMARLLLLLYNKHGDWKPVVDFFKSNSLDKTFKDMT